MTFYDASFGEGFYHSYFGLGGGGGGGGGVAVRRMYVYIYWIQIYCKKTGNKRIHRNIDVDRKGKYYTTSVINV